MSKVASGPFYSPFPSILFWCSKFLLYGSHTFSDIQIEEIAIQDGLHNTSNDCNNVKESLEVVTVDPVE